MPWSPTSLPRLYVSSDLAAGLAHACTPEQTNYLASVLRLDAGAHVLAFNGRDGEWLCEIARSGRRNVTLTTQKQVRRQTVAPDLHYLFAPLKRARLDYMVQKAAEMGASHLQPVMTRHTQAERVNLERMHANAVEAAEQCGTLSIPSIGEPVRLDKLLAGWPTERRIVYCDESADVADPVATLQRLQRGPMAVLIGPEGGFSQDERDLLRRLPYVTAISLGPRILRADTAAVAALALVCAVLGDWRGDDKVSGTTGA